MEQAIASFDIYPLVFPADSDAVINVKPLFEHVFFKPNYKIYVDYSPMLYPVKGYETLTWGEGIETPSELLDGTLVIKQHLSGEQDHGFVIYVIDTDNNKEIRLKFNVYSLEKDLLALRPYKGNIHMHSTESDGLESPEYVTAASRREGVDFMVLTDHHKYQPSLRAIKFAKSLPVGLKVFPGEEVHLPDNPVHIVNFGGSFGVNALAKSDEPNYRKEVKERMKIFPDEMPEHIRFQIAASEWAYDKIREGGGLAMFCHPYWRILWRYNYIWEDCIDWMFKRSKFDILELIGGFYRDQSFSNNEQTARYVRELVESGGKVKWAIAGVSDAHGCERDLFGWFYTILFAEDCSFESVKKAFKNRLSVAVKSIGKECPEIYGELRYIRYVGFLMEHFYPRHDSLCRTEGELMIRHLAGEHGIKEILQSFPDRSEALLEKYWMRDGKQITITANL